MKTVIGWMGSRIQVDDSQKDSVTAYPSSMRVIVLDDGMMKAITEDEHIRLSAEEKKSASIS